MLNILNIASGTLTLLAYVPYIRAILRGETKPNGASWWIWAGIGFLLLSTYYSLGSTAGLGLALGAFTGQTITAILSLRYGAGRLKLFDWACVTAALATTLLWYLTSSPFLPHVLIVLIDFFGFLPTFHKVWHDPASENRTAWVLWTIAASFSLFNAEHWSVAEMLYPTYIVITDGLLAMWLLLKLNRRQ